MYYKYCVFVSYFDIVFATERSIIGLTFSNLFNIEIFTSFYSNFWLFWSSVWATDRIIVGVTSSLLPPEVCHILLFPKKKLFSSERRPQKATKNRSSLI